MSGRRTALPSPWRRTDHTGRKTSAVYAHPNGWRIEHCGHMTALWPYALYDPDGRLIIASNGKAFRTLMLAAAEVLKRAGQ